MDIKSIKQQINAGIVTTIEDIETNLLMLSYNACLVSKLHSGMFKLSLSFQDLVYTICQVCNIKCVVTIIYF